MDNRYESFIGGVFLKYPRPTGEIVQADLPSKITIFRENKDKNKVLLSKILLTIITVFIIVPIILLPPIGIMYLANIYESQTLRDTIFLVAIVSGIWGYILFLWVKLQFFEILN